MASSTRAGIELNGSVVRYAALSGRDESLELLRLGRCDFDFDAGRELLAARADERLEDVAGALRDVFSGLDPEHLRVALSPVACLQFFAPVSRDSSPSERNESLHWQARHLRGEVDTGFKMVVCPLDRSRRAAEEDWYHVLALDRVVLDNFTRLADAMGGDLRPRFRGTRLTGYQIAARISNGDRPGRADLSDGRLGVLVGAYADRREYTLVENKGWVAGAVADGPDRQEDAYHVARLLDEFDRGAESVGRVFLYGPETDDADGGSLAEIFPDRRERLDPFQAINIDADQVQEGFAHWEYVPALGVAL